jgi:chorismate dehydratase
MAAGSLKRAAKTCQQHVWMTLGLRIAAVSYLNTVPLIYGIEHASDLRADLLLSAPDQCAKNFADGNADLALVPVEAIPTLANARQVGSWCIGTNGGVRTVMLMTDEPLHKIRKIYTDPHSLTSARLVRILCRELWGISPDFERLADYSLFERRAPGDAFLLIGDKVFDREGATTHALDLSDAWRELTGLPFVFAAWVARGNVPRRTVELLDDALAYGVAHVPQAVAASAHADKPYAVEYLTKNIDFRFDDPKRQALDLFWEKSGQNRAR